MKILSFFNNKGGVGKTTLVYHLAHMFAALDKRVLLVDLDPQSNLTAMCLPEDKLVDIWPDSADHPATLLGGVRPIIRGVGDIAAPKLQALNDNLSLLPGDLGLARFEDQLADAWPRAMDAHEAAFRALSAFYRIALQAHHHQGPFDLIVLDVGPNLGAINRAALLATDFFVMPLAPDLFSLQGLRNLAPTLAAWRQGWRDRLPRNPDPDLALPAGRAEPLGYIVMQAGMRAWPVRASERWVHKIPAEYRQLFSPDTDPSLGIVKNYQSLMPLAREAQRPMFELRPGDGAIGSHLDAVRRCRNDFEQLATTLLTRIEARE